MIKIILSGCNGKMGKVITSCIKDRNDCCIVAGIDKNFEITDDFPVFESPEDVFVDADVIIDFSHPSLTSCVLDYAVKKNLPVVVSTTGLSEEQKLYLEKVSIKIPVFFSANMSIGVNLILELCKKAAAILENDFDIEIIEKHHNQKIDAPSGTALMLADGINEALKTPDTYVYDRHSVRKKRDKNEIGIHSVRGGTIVGEHDVIFAGRDEVITITHSALSKEIFAVGAVNAAIFLSKQKAGLYNMKNIVE